MFLFSLFLLLMGIQVTQNEAMPCAINSRAVSGEDVVYSLGCPGGVGTPFQGRPGSIRVVITGKIGDAFDNVLEPISPLPNRNSKPVMMSLIQMK